MIARLALAVVAVTTIGSSDLSGGDPLARDTTIVSSDPTSVYRQLLDLRAQQSGERRVILQATPTLDSPRQRLDRSRLRDMAREGGATSELVEAIGRLPTEAGGLAAFRDRSGVTLLAADKFEDLFDGAPSPAMGWEEFFERFEDASGFLHFSPVAFSPDGQEAGVVETFLCGVECGQSRLIILEETGGTWTLTAEVPLWIP